MKARVLLAMALAMLVGRAAASPSTDARTSWRSALAGWPARPRLAAEQMAWRYGAPSLVGADRLEWRDVGAFVRVRVNRQEVPHDFPRPHTDYLEHTVAYRVPPDRVAALLAFDGSLAVDRTAGELTARGDLERHNVLALNLAHDLVIGATTVGAAREAFGRALVDEALGRAPVALAFGPPAGSCADPDLPVLPGSPLRPPPDGDPAGDAAAGDVAEILGFVVAMDDAAILAALEVEARLDVPPEVRAYAAMLHAEHGQELLETLALGAALGVRPLETTAVDGLRRSRAADLAALLRLDGEAFAATYVQGMVEDHADAMERLERYVSVAPTRALQRHLVEARSHALAHLEAGRSLQSTVGRRP